MKPSSRQSIFRVASRWLPTAGQHCCTSTDGDPKTAGAAGRVAGFPTVVRAAFRVGARWATGRHAAPGPAGMRGTALAGPAHVLPVAKYRQSGRLPRSRSRHRRRNRSGSARQPQPARIAQHRPGQRAVVQAGNHHRDANRQHRFRSHHPAFFGIGRGSVSPWTAEYCRKPWRTARRDPKPDRQVYRAERPGFCQELQISAMASTHYVDWGNRL